MLSAAFAYPEVTFSQNTLPETNTQNIIVPTSDARLYITTIDNKNGVVANAGIIADPQSASQTGTLGISSPANFSSTDSQGHTYMTLRGGTYYLRASLPDASGYINPTEQSITIGPGEIKQITLVFIKKDTVTGLYLRGITRLDDGAPVDAFVWAWSEKGRTASGNANTQGEFALQISPDDKWHISAAKSVSDVGYKSSEIVVQVGSQTTEIELILNRLASQTNLAPATNTSSSGQDIVTQTGTGAKVLLPANSLSASGDVTVKVNPTIEVPSQPSAKVFGSAIDVTVRNSSGMELKQFNNQLQVELPYDSDDLARQGINQDNLRPSYFDTTTGSWVKIDDFTIDKIRKVIVARVNHLTLFAVVLAADITPPSIPTGISGTALGQGQISLTWVNPSNDLDHINIYRSENPSTLGRLEGTTTGVFFLDDIEVKNGATYYYVIRAVDPAGNETANTTPIAVKAIGSSSKPFGSSSLKEGDMISAAGSSDPDIYIINPYGYKRLFLNPVIFSFYGHLGGFKNVKSVSASTRDSYQTSGLFRNCETDDPKVYGVEVTGEDSGTLHWVNISGSQAANEDPDFFNRVFCINSNEFNWYAKSSSYVSLGQVPNYSRR